MRYIHMTSISPREGSHMTLTLNWFIFSAVQSCGRICRDLVEVVNGSSLPSKWGDSRTSHGTSVSTRICKVFYVRTKGTIYRKISDDRWHYSTQTLHGTATYAAPLTPKTYHPWPDRQSYGSPRQVVSGVESANVF